MHIDAARLQGLLKDIAILQREHDSLIPLVIDGPPHLRSLRLRQLKFIERRLAAAQATEAWISGSAARLH